MKSFIVNLLIKLQKMFVVIVFAEHNAYDEIKDDLND